MTTMTIQLVNPEGSVINSLYHHIAIATGNTLIYMAGQVTWGEHGQLVARGDLADQVAQVYRNVAKCLVAGTTFHDVVRITWHAANWECSMYDDFAAGAEQAAPEFDMP
jgi:enamine deaminase RidA (YjgF/YER057c/UK114 family)